MKIITPGIPQISPAARYLSSLSDLFLVIHPAFSIFLSMGVRVPESRKRSIPYP